MQNSPPRAGTAGSRSEVTAVTRVNALCSDSALKSGTRVRWHRRVAQEFPSGYRHSETLRIPSPAKSTTARLVPMSWRVAGVAFANLDS